MFIIIDVPERGKPDTTMMGLPYRTRRQSRSAIFIDIDYAPFVASSA
jgi:hypothetical protein